LVLVGKRSIEKQGLQLKVDLVHKNGFVLKMDVIEIVFSRLISFRSIKRQRKLLMDIVSMGLFHNILKTS